MQAPLTFLIRKSRVSWTERITPNGHMETTKTTNQLVRGCKEAMSCQPTVSFPANNLQDRKHMFIWKQEQESCNLTVMVISVNLNQLEDYLACRLSFLVCVFSASVLHRALTFWVCFWVCLIWRRHPLHMFLTI